MYSYFYKLSATPITDGTMTQSEPHFACLEAALERACWHTRLPGMEYRFGCILDDHRGIVVIDAVRFVRWLSYRAALAGEAA